MSDQNSVVKSIGLFGAITILVGFVVSASIFVLPGGLAATAGPGMFLSFLLAAIPAVFSCIVAAQVAGFFPVSGASYVAISRMLSPRVGFLCMWLLISGAAIAMALLAVGAGSYLQMLIPGADVTVTAIALIVLLCVMNLISTRVAISSQEFMVVLFVVAIGLFCVAGLPQLEPKNLDPLLPHGIEGVISAAIPAFFAYVGFMVIVDIGGEVREPSKTIPLALGLSFVIILGLYTAFGITLVGVLPWSELAGMGAPVSVAAAKVLPSWAVTFITLSTVFAAASTINGILLGYSRDVRAMAVQGVLPSVLALTSLNKSSEIPHEKQEDASPRGSIIFMALSAIALVLLGGKVTEYAVFVVMAALVVQVCLAASVWRVPTREPDLYETADFKLSKRGLYMSSSILMVVSLTFLIFAFFQNVEVGLLAVAYGFLGIVYYSFFRKKQAVPELANDSL